MKKSEKKLISIVLVFTIIVSTLSICYTAFAKSQRLILDVLYTNAMDGSEDLLWYIYTPEVSGTYSFLSYNVPHSEAYLFTKESDATGMNKVMTQLAYSALSPGFEERGQSGIIQFCLTYHLEAGTTYYYAAGWWSDERVSGTMKVMLTCDAYDDVPVSSIDVSSSASYEENTNGSWKTDSLGESYFSYDTNRIMTNLTVTVHYTDGTSSTVTGLDEIDGHPILYNSDQSENHWYPASNILYTGNTITVTVLGVSTEYHVVITESDLKVVTLKIVDYSTGDAIQGATVTRGNDYALSDENGIAVISMKGGANSITVSDYCAISRDITVKINPSVNATDFTESPVGIVTGDYNCDNVINGKDYAYILRNFTNETQSAEISRFEKQVNFKKERYPELVLQ